jgi:hypothetical protein
MSDESPAIDEGEIHDVLRNARRRELISFLGRHDDGYATIQDLSEHIARLESGEDPPPRNVRQSVYVSLHQTHLPKLEALGIVDYDTESKDVRLRDRASQVEEYMRPANGNEQWPELYVGLGALGALLSIGATVIGVDGGLAALPVFIVIVLMASYQAWGR